VAAGDLRNVLSSERNLPSLDTVECTASRPVRTTSKQTALSTHWAEDSVIEPRFLDLLGFVGVFSGAFHIRGFVALNWGRGLTVMNW
jgi:hypothetical protein